MGSAETSVFRKLQVNVSPLGWRLFRNLVGGAWMGRVTEERMLDDHGKPLHMVELINAFHVTTGLGTGSSDAVGWRPVVITQEMVGQTLAQFVAAELKTIGYKKVTDEQRNFLQQVADAGGLAMIVKEVKDGEIEIQEVKKSKLVDK